MALPSIVSFGTVRGVFLRAVADTADDLDREPQGDPIPGLTIKFEADLPQKVVTVQGADVPVTVLLETVTATTNDAGVLIGPDGAEDIVLIASTDPDIRPSGWSWKVTVEGARYQRQSFSFFLAPGATVDLSTVVPVSANPGAEVQAWVEAVNKTATNVEAAHAFRDDAEYHAGRASGFADAAAGAAAAAQGSATEAAGVVSTVFDYVVTAGESADAAAASAAAAQAAADGTSSGGATTAYVDAEITEAKDRANHTGTQSADTITDGTTNKVFTAAERTKLAGIEDGATAGGGSGSVPAASQTTAGIVRLGTSAEVLSGTGNVAVIPSTLNSWATAQPLNTFDAPDGNVDLGGEQIVNLGEPTVAGHATTKTYVDTGDTAAKARANHTGTQSADTITDGTTNKAFLATERTKLAGIATGATANATDAQLRDRATHTGTQTAATISDFQTAVSANTDVAANTTVRQALAAPSYAGTRTHPYDATTSIYNGTGAALRNARTKLAAARTGLCRISFVGDSVTAGSGATPGTDDPVTRVRERFQALGYTVGELVSLANRANGGNLQDSRIALSGTWGVASTNYPFIYSSTAGSTITYTSAVPGTVLEIEYGNGTGSFTYSIDGATAVTVNETNTGANALLTVTGLADAKHTVVITQVGTVENNFTAVGVRGTTGVVLQNHGIGGASAQDFSADTSWYRPLGVIGATNPDLVVLELGLNDGYYGTTPLATFKTNMQTIIGFFGASKVLLTASHVLSGTYVSGIYDLADTNNVPLLDLRDRIGGDTTTTAGITGDGIHFTTQGYQVKAAALVDLLEVDGGSKTASGVGPGTLADAATIATDVSRGSVFRVTIAADRTLGAPSNPTDGQRVLWAVTASGANRTLTLATGLSGAFKYGTDITTVPVIASGTTTYIGATYNATAARWHVLAAASGY